MSTSLKSHYPETEDQSKLNDPFNSDLAGNLKNLCKIAVPLMLSSLSGTIMILVDRVILSQYDIRIMGPIAAAGVAFAVFQFGAIAIASIAEVFVGQYNGAKERLKMAIPVWQMIYFALLTIVPFWILGLWGSPWVLSPEILNDAQPFFRGLCWFGFIFPLNAALSSFFIAKGEVKVITISLVLGNGINILLDYLFIFGYGFIPSYGALGAAMATGTAQLIIATMLFIRFLSKYNRIKYRTAGYAYNHLIFMNCLKIGVPVALSHMISIGAWAIVMQILVKVGNLELTLFAIYQSVWILLSFITEGNQKAVSALTANYIGANQFSAIRKLFIAAIKLQMAITIMLAIPLMLFPEAIYRGFLLNEADNNLLMIQLLCNASIWICLTFLLDGLAWIIAGILTASGNTRFIMLTNTINSWVFGVCLYYLCMLVWKLPAQYCTQLIIVYATTNGILFYLRFRNQKWDNSVKLV